MNFFEHTLSKYVWNYATGKKQKTNKIAESESKNKSQYGTENFPLLSSGYILINNDNKTKWSPIWYVIIQEINKIGRPSPIFLSQLSMITDRIGRHQVLLTINQNQDKILESI